MEMKKIMEMVEDAGMELEEVRSGIAVIRNGIEEDFEEANDLFSEHNVLRHVDAEEAYTEREWDVLEKFCKTYAVGIERHDDYERFVRAVEGTKRDEWHKNNDYYNVFINAVKKQYFDNEISSETVHERISELRKQSEKGLKLLDKMERFEMPDFEEWKNGRYKSGMKIGKALVKAKYNKKVTDFYAMQVKDEKTVFITISALPQFIAGMSAYGQGWSSCQNVRNNGGYGTQVAGSLHDDTLYIAFMHDSLDDLHNMDDKMLARTVMRKFTVEGHSVLVSTSVYGQYHIRQSFIKALESLSVFDIFEHTEYHGYDKIQEEANGEYHIWVSDEIEQEYYLDSVEAECPVCGGSGDIEYNNPMTDDYEYTTCPHCEGEGTVEIELDENVTYYIPIEIDEYVTTYNEDYRHNVDYTSISVDGDKIVDVLIANHMQELEAVAGDSNGDSVEDEMKQERIALAEIAQTVSELDELDDLDDDDMEVYELTDDIDTDELIDGRLGDDL